MRRRRNFRCEFKGGYCDDPRCTADRCVPLEEDRLDMQHRELIRAAPEILEIREHARKFAMEVLKHKRMRVTEEKLQKLMENPRILAEAKRRVQWLRSSNSD